MQPGVVGKLDVIFRFVDLRPQCNTELYPPLLPIVIRSDIKNKYVTFTHEADYYKKGMGPTAERWLHVRVCKIRKNMCA